MSTPVPIIELVRAVKEATSAQDLFQATRFLASAEISGEDDLAAITCLVEVLGFNNPGAAVAAVEGLIRLGPVAVEPLLRNLDPRNYGARAWAVRALAGIGDVRGLEVLEEALATDVGPSVRRSAAAGLGGLRLGPVSPGERLEVRERALSALEAGGADPEWVVRYAVVVGLEKLGRGMDPPAHQLHRAINSLERLAHPTREAIPVVRLRADQALQRLG